MYSRKQLIALFCSAFVAVLIINWAVAKESKASNDEHKNHSHDTITKVDKTKSASAKLIKDQLPFYPLKNCVVMKKEKLNEESINYLHEGRLVRFCCADCKDSFKTDPEKYLKQLDEAVIKAQSKAYPLKKCVVLDSKLGSMGKPVDFVYNNRLVRFCCAGCKKSFLKTPDKYLAKIDSALAKKSPVFTCSMHPKVKSAKAGKCPICSMKLQLVKEEKELDKKEKPDHDSHKGHKH